MKEALPTPYDIVGLPVFAWQPGIFSWLICLTVAALALCLPLILRRRRSLLNAWQTGINELTFLPTGGQAEIVQLALASAIAKRLCGLCEKRDFSGMSPKELEIAANDSQGTLAHLLHRLAGIDRLRYGGAPQPEQHAASLITELTKLLELHWHTRQNEVKK